MKVLNHKSVSCKSVIKIIMRRQLHTSNVPGSRVWPFLLIQALVGEEAQVVTGEMVLMDLMVVRVEQVKEVAQVLAVQEEVDR